MAEHDDGVRDVRGRHLYRVADPISLIHPAMILLLSRRHRWNLEILGVSTGERRHPKKGEWFLSGAIPEVYEAQNDLSMVYTICELIVVERSEIYTEVTQ